MPVAAADSRLAIVLFNLGAPDRPEAVQPFLFNLFNDPAIIRLPGVFRTILAGVASRKRAKEAVKIYQQIGGGSPLLPNTQAQAEALQAALGDLGTVRTFVAMRYWHPMSLETASEVQDFDPDEIVLLPLYPQFSTTTSASSLRSWDDATRALGLKKPTRAVCCYPVEAGFIAAAARLVAAGYEEASAHGPPRILFSAHGLPKKIVLQGDPYQWQCERTAAAIVEALARENLDWSLCFQSRVGPLEWIGPSTEAEIDRAGNDRVPVVIVPLAFVSDHSETLVEIDIEYRARAEEAGVPYFHRIPAVGVEPEFIEGLAQIVRQAMSRREEITSNEGRRICLGDRSGCPITSSVSVKP